MLSTQDFLAKIQQYGGIDRTNLFMVQFTPSNNSVEFNSDLRFFCKTAALPGIDITTSEYKPQGHGMGIQLPTGISNTGLSCIFILDSYNVVLSYFHRWAASTYNYNEEHGTRSSTNGMLPHEIGYLRGDKGYGATATITKFNPYDLTLSYQAVLRDVYPINIGSVSLTWEEQNTFSTLPISFTYSSVSFSGIRGGTNEGSYNRGVGDITRLAGMNRDGQTINDFVNNNIGI